MEDSFVNISLYVSYLLVVLAVLAAIILPLINALGNPKSLVKSLIGIGTLVVLFLVSWAIAGDEVTAVYTKFNITSTLSKVIGGVLITTYLLMGVAILSIIYSEVRKLAN